jgi:hypothetical protein
MLQEKSVSRCSKKPVRATYYRSRAAKSGTLRQFLHYYRIEAPRSTPFLTSDDTLKALVSTVPTLKFLRCNRWHDRDVLCVYGANGNILTLRARGNARKIRNDFLEDVASLSTSESRVPQYLKEACHRFIIEAEMIHLHWDGMQVVSHNSDGKTFEGRCMSSDKLLRLPFLHIERACANHDPFTFGAPPDR